MAASFRRVVLLVVSQGEHQLVEHLRVPIWFREECRMSFFSSQSDAIGAVVRDRDRVQRPRRAGVDLDQLVREAKHLIGFIGSTGRERGHASG